MAGRANINKEETWEVISPADVAQVTLKLVKQELADHRVEMSLLIDSKLEGTSRFHQMATDNRALLQILGIVMIVGFVVGGIFIARSF